LDDLDILSNQIEQLTTAIANRDQVTDHKLDQILASQTTQTTDPNAKLDQILQALSQVLANQAAFNMAVAALVPVNDTAVSAATTAIRATIDELRAATARNQPKS
jgi:hypothetical protein